MAFNPNLPVDHSPIVAAELRNQFNALQAQITALQTQVTALQNKLNDAAHNPQQGEFDPGFNDPPQVADLQAVQDYLNQLVAGLQNWP